MPTQMVETSGLMKFIVSMMPLGVLAVLAHGEVAELAVGHEHPVHDERGPDAGSQRDGDHEPAVAARLAVEALGKAGRVGVVDHVDGAPARLGELGGYVDAHPGLVEVGHEADGPAGVDRRREGNAHRHGRVHLKVVEQLRDDLRDRLGRGLLRGGDAQALCRKAAALKVDGRPLDAGPTDVDAKSVHAVPPVPSCGQLAKL